jgi:hypothetical protein
VGEIPVGKPIRCLTTEDLADVVATDAKLKGLERNSPPRSERVGRRG